MKVVIIEDETAAALNFRSLLVEIFPKVEIMAVLESVIQVVEWFEQGNKPDIVFMDIHLADGNAFMIFNKIEILSPIIFTTAYDQYALEAFKVNSIDYLLKPIKSDELQRAVAKLELLANNEMATQQERIAETARQYTNFLLHVRDRIVPLKSEEIAFCYTLNERVTIYTKYGRKMPYDKSLDTMMEQLDGQNFYRINRQFIIAREAVCDISVWSGSRIRVNLCVATPEKIIVSKVRTPEFKRWIVAK